MSVDHGIWSVQAPVTAGTDQDVLFQQTNSAIAKWRLVSSGLKIQLLNNSDENEGYFECARLQTSAVESNYCLYAMDGTSPAGPFVADDQVWVAPVIATVGGAASESQFFGIESTALVESPTYRTGKLRDIHKYIFALNPNGRNHGWTNLTGNASGKISGPLFSVGNKTISNDDIINYNRDQNYDCMVIRIHGRNLTGTPNTPKTKVLIQSAHNLEIVYETGQPLARYHTEGHVASLSTSNKKKWQKNQYKKAVNKRWGYT